MKIFMVSDAQMFLMDENVKAAAEIVEYYREFSM